MQEQVTQIVCDILGLKSKNLDADTPLDRLAEWDSLKQINLALSLEEEFGVSLTADEMGRLNTIANIVTILSRHRGST